VSFMDNDQKLAQLANEGNITQNIEHLGSLLRNFFFYYGRRSSNVINGGFCWSEDIVSIRSQGGLIRKQSKGWTSANVTVIDGVEVKNRYLLAIECPLETDHNVARTVHHRGICAIRDELRRACDLLHKQGIHKHIGRQLLEEYVDP